MTKEEFFAKVANTNVYLVLKKLPPPLDYAAPGDMYGADILYERGYSINMLVSSGHIELANQPFEWQKFLVGKNLKIVLSVCPECGSHGVNLPLDTVCGNCNYPKTITYYDVHTINLLLKDILK